MEQQRAQSRPLIHLPEEIVIDILLQMPVKSLVRFRCVCKRWRSLLSGDRDFSAGYLCRKRRRHGYLLMSIKFHVKLQLLLSLIQDELPDRTVEIELPPPQRNEEKLWALEVVGSIDGVFCLLYYNQLVDSSILVKEVVLWNPATREFHHTPYPEIFIRPESELCSLRFGFARGDDGSSFKVVVIVESLSPVTELGLDVEEVEVYDSRSDAWTGMDNPPNTFHSFDSLPCAIVNGVPYWRSTDWSGSIISFDPATNKFRQFKGPEFGVEVANGKSWSVGEIDEVLVAIAPRQDKNVDVWKLVDDDHRSDDREVIWIKLFSFGPMDGVKWSGKCWKNGEFLVRTKLGYCLWDYWSKQIRVFPDLPSPDWWINDVFLFTETLVPPRHHVLPHLNSGNPGVTGNENRIEGKSNGNDGKGEMTSVTLSTSFC